MSESLNNAGRRCESVYEPLTHFGVHRQCMRKWGHTRSWHEIVYEDGGRVRWEWGRDEREAVKQELRLQNKINEKRKKVA